VVKIKGQEYQLDIHDTAGQDEFSILGSKQAVGLHGWILVYSISSRQSFDMISIIRDKVLDYTGADSVPIVIVGNKSDLGDAQRAVPIEEAAALAKKVHDELRARAEPASGSAASPRRQRDRMTMLAKSLRCVTSLV